MIDYPAALPDEADAAPPHKAAAWPEPQLTIGLALAYAGAATLSIALSREPGDVANIWFANALAMAVLMHREPARWPAPLAVVMVGNVLANRLWGDDLATAVLFVPPNLVEIVLGAWLLRRAGVHRSDVRNLRPLLKLLLLGAVLPQLAGATLGAVTLSARGVGAPEVVWQSWFEGAVIGALSTLPLAAMALGRDPAWVARQLFNARVASLAPLAVGLSLLCLAEVPHPFVMLSLPLLLAATLVDAVAVALLTLLVSMTAAVALALGVLLPPPTTRHWQEVYLYLGYAAALVPALLLAASVTKLRDSHARLAERTDELRRANEGLEQFVHIAAHDLREPLNTIVQFTGLVREDPTAQFSGAASGYLDLVQRAAGRMRMLLDDMLQYARLRANLGPPTGTVPLQLALAEALQALAGRIETTGAEVQVDETPSAVRGHAPQLALLMQNLIGNAIKFVPPGTRPQVRVRFEPVEGGMVRVSVQDNGIGIAAEDLPKLFKPFQRLNLRRQYEGTGLGLALCRQVVEAHGGRIEVLPGAG
jgi:signal transduction histidine kinase